MTAVYAVSDPHGYVDELRAALEDEGLIDDDHWTGRDARLWFLGDFFDRGPDGIAVLDLVRRLVAESEGAVQAVIGNHEILAIGMRMFGATPSLATPRTFEQLWHLCGGKPSDQQGSPTTTCSGCWGCRSWHSTKGISSRTPTALVISNGATRSRPSTRAAARRCRAPRSSTGGNCGVG